MRTYYTNIFPDGAKRAAEQYRRVCEVIRENPLIGHPVDGMVEVREFSIPRTPFSVVFKLTEGEHRHDEAEVGPSPGIGEVAE